MKQKVRGQCKYCYGMKENLRLCRLRASAKDGWQEPLWVCNDCRKYLRGYFKYVEEQK